MPARRLSAEESALWAKVAASVRPLFNRARPIVEEPAHAPPVEGRTPTLVPPSPKWQPPTARRVAPGETLDGGWDRRLSRGLVAPDRSIDLHGHTVASAHAELEHALARAVTADDRLLLVVTGRPPREERGMGPPRRGLIRAAIGDWLAVSSHAGRIAAVRNAHPRHGGAGALYVVLRRRR